jgi:hypothetical protein
MRNRRVTLVEYPIIRTGLVGWWPLNDGSGFIAQDKTDNANNGTLTNMEANDWITTPQRLRGGLNFDGTNEYIANVGNVSSYSFVQNTSVFSMMAWVNLSSITDDRIDAIMGNSAIASSERGFTFFYENRIVASSPRRLTFVSLRGASGSRLQALGGFGVLTTGWHHVACTANGSTCQLYVDAETDAAAQPVLNDAPIGDATRELYLGAFNSNTPPAFPLKGGLSDVRIYNRALSTDELTAIFKGIG